MDIEPGIISVLLAAIAPLLFWLIIAVESGFKKVQKQNEQLIELLKRMEEKENHHA
ncbi:hypothetical protein [Bacillus taeanensis]|uniref:hypothetical protein n=1 Tax=Bacillus taeanensis TaxID=273032 RepID=UPI0015F0EFD6|nr:hypothetical protein [Bacillus taeanensis]